MYSLGAGNRSGFAAVDLCGITDRQPGRRHGVHIHYCCYGGHFTWPLYPLWWLAVVVLAIRAPRGWLTGR